MPMSESDEKIREMKRRKLLNSPVQATSASLWKRYMMSPELRVSKNEVSKDSSLSYSAVLRSCVMCVPTQTFR